MNRNWVLTIGINNYRNLQALRYAKQDAEALQRFFLQDIACLPEQIYHFSDDGARDRPGLRPLLRCLPHLCHLATISAGAIRTSLFRGRGQLLVFFLQGMAAAMKIGITSCPLMVIRGIFRALPCLCTTITERLQRCGGRQRHSVN
jgi:hypothetical protein